MTTPHLPNFLLSQSHLNLFVSGEEEKKEILRTPPAATSLTQGRIWKNKESDFDQLYYLVSGYFLQLASYLLHAVFLTDLSKRVWITANHTLQNATVIKANRVFKENLLSPSINTHRLDSSDYFLHPPIKTQLPTHPTPGEFTFFHSHGICRGMSHWFVHLFFKTKAFFSNTDLHLQAVGKQFEQGAPNQAALFHSLEMPSIYQLLPIKACVDEIKISTKGKTELQIIHQIQSQPPGVYGIYTSTHQMVYIKVDESRQYLFDPNIGVLKTNSPLVFKKAMHTYMETHDHSKEIHIDLYNPV